MADISKIKLPNGTTYDIKDDNALPLTGGSVTGPVSFGDSVSIDEATVGDLVVNGSASFTNGAHGVIDKAKAADVTSTLNALVKYEDTEGTFSDSNIYNTSNNLIIGSTSVPGNIQIGAKNDNYGILPNTNNYNQIGSSSLYWYRAYVNNYYGLNSHVTNWDAGKNIGTASTSSAAATLGSVYFYNACAAGGTQTKTLLSNGNAASNITVTLPNTTGTLALTSQIPDISGKADKATTLSGYGITDAKIASGVITLGSNTITPLTSSSSLNAAKLTGTVPTSCYTNTTYSDFTAATASAAGAHGLVPAPSAGSQNRVLFGDKTWKEFNSQVAYAGDKLTLSLSASTGSGSSTSIASFNIQPATDSIIGVMSAADKSYIDTLASTLGEVNKPSEYTVSSITSGNTYKTTGYGFDLSPGTYIIIGRIEFPANATGVRAVEWYQTTGTSGGVYHSQVTTPAATGGFPTRLQAVAIVEPEETQTYQLYVYQNSGATLSNAKVSIRSIRIS